MGPVHTRALSKKQHSMDKSYVGAYLRVLLFSVAQQLY